MQFGTTTTPFGQRGAKLTLVKQQVESESRHCDRKIDKWSVFRDICEARLLLGLQDRPLSVLNALLSFYPDTLLSEEEGLIVFPSNMQLSVRAHGISGATLRRALSRLVEIGLIERRDSPNGKRYAHRSRDGEIETAYGFNLKPLLLRAEELAGLAQQAAAERIALKRLREMVTLCRRDVRKLISAAMEEGKPGDWASLEAQYIAIIARFERNCSMEMLSLRLQELEALRDLVFKLLDFQVFSQNKDGNPAHNEQHIQNSKPKDNPEFEPGLEKAEPENLEVKSYDGGVSQLSQKNQAFTRPTDQSALPQNSMRAFPLSMVLKACPQILDYGPGGQIENWRDLMAAAITVRAMLGVSASAYENAAVIMGAENAAVTMACILERAHLIHNAGGYLRDLSAKAKRGEFSNGPVLMALLRAHGHGLREVAP